MSVGLRLRLQLCSAALSTWLSCPGVLALACGLAGRRCRKRWRGRAGLLAGEQTCLGASTEFQPHCVQQPGWGGWGASSLFAVCLLIPTKPGSVSREDAAWTLQAPLLLCLPHRGLIVEQSFSQPSPPCVFCELCLTHSGTSPSHPSPSAFRSSGEEDVARVIGAPRSDAVTVSIRWTFLTVR